MERNGFIFFTVRNEVAKVMFLHVSVILSTGEGAIPACIADGIPACLATGEVPGPGGPYSRGGAWSREGLLQGVPGPGGGVPGPGGSAPKSRWLLLQMVCILLECSLLLVWETICDAQCRMISIKAWGMFVMHDFIPKRIHQTHTGSWPLVNWRVLLLRQDII